MSYLEIHDVSKTIRGRQVLSNISLSIPKGIIAGFTGINGSGKSMLFRAIAGLITISQGEIVIEGKAFDRTKPYPVQLGLMIDASGFWEHLTGRENLKILASIKNAIGDEEIDKALCRVGLDPNDSRKTFEYSLGMKQRLNLAQAIMEKPDLMILDEPTNALDVQGIALVTDIIKAEVERGATLLISCHNQPQLEELFKIHVSMSDGLVQSVVSRDEN